MSIKTFRDQKNGEKCETIACEKEQFGRIRVVQQQKTQPS
mgnify:CR=1 FL=1|jgi:hypothetical protein